jgi:hypothetical protein
MVFKVKPRRQQRPQLSGRNLPRPPSPNLKQFANTMAGASLQFTIQGSQFDGERVMQSAAWQ